MEAESPLYTPLEGVASHPGNDPIAPPVSPTSKYKNVPSPSVSSLEIKEENFDICDEFANDFALLEALRSGATTVKLEFPVEKVIETTIEPIIKKTTARKSTGGIDKHIKKILERSNEPAFKETIKSLPEDRKDKLVAEKNAYNSVGDSVPPIEDGVNFEGILPRRLRFPRKASEAFLKKTAKGGYAKEIEEETKQDVEVDPTIFKVAKWNSLDKYKCNLDDCKFVTQHAKKLQKHKAKCHKKFQCNRCPYQSNKQTLFEGHFFRHLFDRPYICDICSMSFKQRGKLQRHLRSHDNIKKYQCSECPLAFLERSNLIAHGLTHIDIFPFKCHLCIFQTKYNSCLQQHLISHAGVRSYACELCEYRTITKKALRNHEVSHNPFSPYACPHCPFRAKMKSKLNRHMITHKRRMIFGCIECEYKTLEENKLDNHTKKHISPSFYPCAICFQVFRKKSSLDYHLDRHKLLKDLKCSECNMKQCCMKHQYFDLNIFVCDMCSKRFFKKNSLEKHFMNYHTL